MTLYLMDYEEPAWTTSRKHAASFKKKQAGQIVEEKRIKDSLEAVDYPWLDTEAASGMDGLPTNRWVIYATFDTSSEDWRV